MNIKSNHINDEIPINDIFNLLLDNKKKISLVTIIFAIFSVTLSLSLPNIYKSSSLLSVVNDSSSNGISSLASQYGGIASMAGIALPSSSGEDKSSLVIQTLLSRDFLKNLIKNNNILPQLIAAKKYNTDTKETIYDEKVYSSEKGAWIRKPQKNKEIVPSYLEAHEAYLDIISISKDKLTGFITVSVDHVSPDFAYSFLSLIINELNISLRDRDIKEATDSVAYLRDKLVTTQEKDIQYSLNELIKIQLEKLMLANVRTSYIINPIDSPYVPENKSSPKRAVICIVITIIGFFMSCLYILIRHYTSRETRH